MIVNQKNQGGGAARNNAIPLIQGKYTFFTDHDDWLELELCEKAYQRGEETEADMVYFRTTGTDFPLVGFDPNLPDIRIAPEERTDLLLHFSTSWTKLWRSDFLKANDIRFFKGPGDDFPPSWKGCVLAGRIAILNEILYCWRNHSASLSQTHNENLYLYIETMQELETMLRDFNLYSTYREVFLLHKLTLFRTNYMLLPLKYHPVFREMIKTSLTRDDYDFLHAPSNGLSKKVQTFYQLLEDESVVGRLKFRCSELGSRFTRWYKSKLRSHS